MTDLFTKNIKVQSALEKLFQQHRLVFWYDDKSEMTGLFESLQIQEVEKVVIENNEFTLKHRLLIEQPFKKFLIYQSKEKPSDNDNWLLDLLVSNYEFHTDPSSLYLQDLDLPPEFKSLIQQHEEFFSNEKRISDLKALLETDDMESSIRLKMMSVICLCDPDWEKVLYSLFSEILIGKKDKYSSIEKYDLSNFLWKSIESKYGYKSLNPSLKDFLIRLLQDNFIRSIRDGKPELNREAFLFINRWKENTGAQKTFSDWSLKLEMDLDVENIINGMSIERLLDADTYSVIDKKIIKEIRDHIVKETFPNYSTQELIEKRKVKFFFSDYSQIYNALSYASFLLDEIKKINLTIQNPGDGFEKYEKNWYKIDQLYRKYIYSSEQAKHQNILKDLTIKIEKAYGNSFLLKLGNNWQLAIDKLQNWKIDNVVSQKQFYTQWIIPYTDKGNRVFVIISDALRFESAAELREIILQEDRYTAVLNAVLGSIPSYTQLGMASLLPQSKLTFDEKSDVVYADGISTQGTSNRTKVLQSRHSGSIAISAEDFLKMNAKSEGRDFIKPYNVIYIYSNHIDKIGDDKTSEGKVFEATKMEIDNLMRIMRHINNMNGYNMIVTSDHGYLYQHNRLEETDFTEFTPEGNIYKSSRRFVLGTDLSANSSVQKWTGAEVGFSDNTEVVIPKSINRIRIQGAGSRFVHGGASLQEIVIPVLEINKARISDIEQIEIDIISNTSNISSNTFAVNFYQKQPIGDKMQPRQIKAGFYTNSGQIISDIATLIFNSMDSDSKSREKIQKFNFTSEASKYNGQDIYLKLEEQIEGTNQFKIYKKFTYKMLISFSSEFDEF